VHEKHDLSFIGQLTQSHFIDIIFLTFARYTTHTWVTFILEQTKNYMDANLPGVSVAFRPLSVDDVNFAKKIAKEIFRKCTEMFQEASP
jgi:hypothetical protein